MMADSMDCFFCFFPQRNTKLSLSLMRAQFEFYCQKMWLTVVEFLRFDTHKLYLVTTTPLTVEQ